MMARALGIVAFLVTLVGLGLLGRGVLWAAGPIFFGTPEEYARWAQGRVLMLAATAVLLLAGGLFGLHGRWTTGALIAVPGLVCTLIAYTLRAGGNGLAFVLFFPLALIAFAAAIVAVIRGSARA